MRRARGYNMIELMLAIGLVVGTVLFIGQMGSVAIGWYDMQGRVVAVTNGADALRTSVRTALEAGRPVAALSELPSGELEEGSAPSASRSWTQGPSLIVKTKDGWRVLDRAGGRLVERRLRTGAREESRVILRHVTASSFAEIKDAKAKTRGIAWRVSVSTTPRAIEGVAAFRADEGGAP